MACSILLIMEITRVITVCGIFAYARSTPAKSNIISDLTAKYFGANYSVETRLECMYLLIDLSVKTLIT